MTADSQYPEFDLEKMPKNKKCDLHPGEKSCKSNKPE